MNGATSKPCQSIAGRADSPVKPRSELAHQPGQQPAAVTSHRESAQSRDVRVCATDSRPAPGADLTGALLSRHHRESPGSRAHRLTGPLRPWLCGGVQRGETKSAPETRCGARGGTRLGNPCDETGDR